jgi:hypothetical protein
LAFRRKVAMAMTKRARNSGIKGVQGEKGRTRRQDVWWQLEETFRVHHVVETLRSEFEAAADDTGSGDYRSRTVGYRCNQVYFTSGEVVHHAIMAYCQRNLNLVVQYERRHDVNI